MNIAPQRSAAARIERSATLTVLADLRDHLDEIDLDTIDGEFYWRCCRPDLIQSVDSLRVRIRGLRDRFGDENYGVQTLRDYESLQERYQAEFPNVLDYLVTGGRVALRDAYPTLITMCAYDPYRRQPFDAGSETVVELRVFSSAWTGRDVETRIRRHLDGPWITEEDRIRFEPTPPRPPNSVAVRVAIAFVNHELESNVLPGHGTHAAFSLPHVVVSVGIPLPPEGEIGRLYDSIVRESNGWHQRLHGNATRQEKRVAIRTWAAGLLVGSGQKTAVAIYEACDALNELPVSQVQFSQDRVRLISRVPEASTYLRIKPARGRLQPNR